MPRNFAHRALVLQWLMQGGTDVSPASGNMFLNMALLPEKSEANGKFFQDRTLKFFGDCDRQLARREYLAEELSAADFALYPPYAVRKKLIDDTGTLPDLTRWGDRMAARPGVRKGMQAAL